MISDRTPPQSGPNQCPRCMGFGETMQPAIDPHEITICEACVGTGLMGPSNRQIVESTFARLRAMADQPTSQPVARVAGCQRKHALRDYTAAELRDELVRRGWMRGRVTIEGLPPCAAIVEPLRDAKLRAGVLEATPAKKEDAS